MKNDGTTFVVRRDNAGLWAVADVKPATGTVVQGAELVESQYVVKAVTTMNDSRYKMYLERLTPEHTYCGFCGGHMVVQTVAPTCSVCGAGECPA